jgi:cell division protein FtsW (lipid II flippase)
MIRTLPDSHTDFVLTVAVDGLGVLIIVALLALCSLMLIRARRKAGRSE